MVNLRAIAVGIAFGMSLWLLLGVIGYLAGPSAPLFTHLAGTSAEAVIARSLLLVACILLADRSKWLWPRRDRARTAEELRQANERLHAILDAAPVPIVDIDLEGRVNEIWNAAATRTFGWSADEVKGKPLPMVPEDKAAEFAEGRKRVAAGHIETGSEYERVRRDGAMIPYAVYAAPVRDAEGDVTGIASVLVDLTERRRHEQHITHLNAVLRAIRSISQLLTSEGDLATLLQGVCDRLVETRGYSTAWIAVLEGESSPLVVTAGLRAEQVDALARSIEDGNVRCIDHARAADGVVVTEDPQASCPDCPLSCEATNHAGVTSQIALGDQVFGVINATIPAELAAEAEEQHLFAEITHDIAFALHSREINAKRMWTERSLRESEAGLARAQAVANFGSWEMDFASGKVKLSPHLYEINGIDPESFDGEVMSLIEETFHPEDKEPAIDALHRTMRGEDVGPLEFRIIRKNDGAERMVTAHTELVRDAEGRPIGNVGVVQDVTESRLADLALRDSERRHRALLTGIPDTMLRVRRDGVFLDGRPDAQATLLRDGPGRVGSPLDRVVPEAIADQVLSSMALAFEQRRTQTFECRHLAAGIWREYEARLIPIDDEEALVILRDITERVRAEQEAQQRYAELSHVGRLATLGELAAGLAHELNQPLAAIVNFARGCVRRLDASGHSDPQMLEALELISEQAERAGKVIHSMRRFARKRDPLVTHFDLNALVTDTLEFVAHENRRLGIVVQAQLDSGLPVVAADPVAIQQVLMNLLVNAIDAVSQNHPNVRRLQLTTETGDGMVIVSVQDNGAGISEENLLRIFEPFFTTKREGLGMGLSISQTIIESHGGRLWAESADGATFHFSLPIVSARHVAADEQDVATAPVQPDPDDDRANTKYQ